MATRPVSVTSLSGLEDLLTCAICKGNLNCPKLLTCQHSFCKDCLEHLLDTRGSQSNHTGVLECPVCRKRCPLSANGINDLQSDFRINQVKEALDAIQREADISNPINCDVCKYEPKVTLGTKYCEKCAKRFCDKCSNQHDSNSTFVEHKLVDADDVPDIFCTLHDEERAHLYCSNCEHVVCVVCVMTRCSDHMTCDVQTLAEEYRRQANDQRQSVKTMTYKNQSQMSKLDQSLSEMYCTVKDLREQIHRHTNNMIQKVRTSERCLVAKVDEAYQCFMLEVNNELEQRQKTASSLMEMSRLLDKLSTSSESDIACVRMGGPVLELLAETNESIPDMQTKEIYKPHLRFEPNEELYIGKVCGDSSSENTVFIPDEHSSPTVEKKGIIKKNRLENKNHVTCNDAEEYITDVPKDSNYPREMVTQQNFSIKRSIYIREQRHSMGLRPPFSRGSITEWETLLQQKTTLAAIRRGKFSHGWDAVALPDGNMAVTCGFGYQDDTQKCGELYLFDSLCCLKNTLGQRDTFCPRNVTYHPQLHFIVMTDRIKPSAALLRPTDLELMGELTFQGSTEPCDVAVLRDGKMVISECGKHPFHSVRIHDTDGSFIQKWGTKGKMWSDFLWPHHITVDNMDRIIVSDQGNHCVKIFDKNGHYLRRLKDNIYFPYGVSIDASNNIWVTHDRKGVTVFSPDGKIIGKPFLSDSGLICNPRTVLCNKDNKVALICEEDMFLYKMEDIIADISERDDIDRVSGEIAEVGYMGKESCV